MDEYFDDIGLGSYYDRRDYEDMMEWDRFKKMRTTHAVDENWIKQKGDGNDTTESTGKQGSDNREHKGP